MNSFKNIKFALKVNKLIEEDIFEGLNNSCVKDLYWLLFSECPINNSHPTLIEIPFFPSDILLSWRESSKDYFVNLDNAPSDFLNFLDRPKNKRLGFYAEALLSYFFQTFSEVELLLQNYQLIEDKRTIGEVDFIIKWKGRVIHLESAVKYYLFHDSTDKDQLQNWIGPSCNDNLARKIKKVSTHQLPLVNSRLIFDQVEAKEIESYLFLKGKLFVNSAVNCEWVNRESVGKYLYNRELDSKSLNKLNLIDKPFWLSVLNSKEPLKKTVIKKKIRFEKRAQLVRFPEGYPFFIAPNNWPLT